MHALEFMRNAARQMKPDEIAAVAKYYASRAIVAGRAATPATTR